MTKTGEDEPDASEDLLLDTIGDNAFRGCTNLTRLNVAANAAPSPHSRFGWIGRSDLPGVNIPSGVTTIGAHAFDGCSSIESLKLPAGVRSIGEGAFSNCPHLTLRVLDGSYAQLYAQRNAIPFETIDSIEAMFEWDFTQDEDPSGVIIARYPGNKAEVGIPAAIAWTQVTRIGDEAFKGNKNLISVTISDFVTSIGKGAFEGCDNLKRVYLIGTDTDNGGKYLADYALAGVTVLPGSCPLRTIGEDAFRGCTSLQDMDLALTVSPSSYPPHWWIGQGARSGINIPPGVTDIGAHAFDGCHGIRSLTLPDSVAFIGEGAFDNCPGLILKVFEGSYAQRYTQDNAIPFKIAEK